jgi:cardiolipin synthase
MKAKIWALILFMLASLADLIDGWAARKLNQETEFGKFFDPLADKILVISALVALLLLDPLIPFWMIFIIVARDILITMMRSMALKKNKPLRTSRFGKIKTAFQMGSIVIIIMILIIKKSGFINEKLYSYLNHNSISFFFSRICFRTN